MISLIRIIDINNSN